MSDTGGADATYRLKVEADAAQAAKDLEAKLTAAIVAALNSAPVQAAIAGLIKAITKAMKAMTKESERAWKDATAAGVKSAQTVGDAFKKTAKQSRNAYNANTARGAAPEFAALNALVESLAKNFDLLATDARSFNTVMTQMATSARAQLSAIGQEQRTLQQLTTSQNALTNTQALKAAADAKIAARDRANDARIQSALIRTSSAERVASIRRFTQISTTMIRSLTQVFRTVFNGATVLLRNAVNGMQSVIRGLVSAFRSTFQAINSIVRTFATGFARAFSTIGRGVGAALAGVSRAIRSALTRDEKAIQSSMARRERTMSSSASRQQSMMTRIMQGAGLLGGVGAVTSLLTSGFERAGQQEQLQLTFTTLLHDGPKAAQVLDEISQFARTTAFDFVEVAGSVAQLTAGLGDVDEAFNLTKFLADVTALTGGTTDQLAHARLAFSQIAGSGRLAVNDINQLVNALPGIPIMQILADSFFGGDVAAANAARESGELGGKISSDAFFEAFQSGVKERFPEIDGFAQQAAGTLTGLAANLKENFAIFGATLINLVAGPLKSFMGGLNEAMDLAGQFISGEMFKRETTPWGTLLPQSDNMLKLQLFRDVLGDVIKALGLLLALKGVWEIFGLIGKGVALALTPMGLLVVAVAGITAAFGFFRRTNEKFAATWGVVVDQVRPAIDAFKRLGRALRGAFGGGEGGDGKPTLLTRIGDGMRYVNIYLARLIRGFAVFADVLSDGLELEGFKNFGTNLDKAVASGLSVLFYGVDSEAAMTEAKERGGSLILNLLEGTFLGPVIRFFRGPFLNVAKTVIGFISNIVGQIASAVGDIWGIVFGGGQDEQDQMIASVLGGPADDRSKGTKILDRLEETFLGPVVRFFRGPFADAIEGVGGFIGGVFQNFLIPGFKAVTNFFAHDFIPGVINIASAIGRFFEPAVRTLGNLLGQVGTLLAPIGGAIEGFIGTWQDEGIGGALDSLWDGIAESAGNLWEGVDGTGGLKAGLESALNSVQNWFADNFTWDNLSKAAFAAINGIRTVGRAIGKFLSSPEFIGTVTVAAAAFAGIVATILGAFLVGLGEGIAQEVPRWLKLISSALVAGWNALSGSVFNFLPKPIIDGIDAMLRNPLIATGILGGLAYLGTQIVSGLMTKIGTAMKKEKDGKTTTSFANLGINIAKGLFDSVVNGIKGLTTGGVSLAKMLIPKFPADTGDTAATAGRGIGARVMGGMNTFFRRTVVSPIQALQTRMTAIGETAKDKFGGVGTAIATAVIGGIAAYEMGNYAGKTGSGGALILALLGAAATGGSIGAAFGGVGAGIGAAIGLGIAGLGYYFGQAAKEAKEFDDVVKSIRSSLEGMAGDNANQALIQNMSDRLTGDATVFEEWGRQLSESFDFSAFVQSILDGTAEADTAFASFISGMEADLVATGEVGGDVMHRFTDSLTLAAKSGDYQNATDLLNRVFANFSDEEIRQINAAMEAMPGGFVGIIDGTDDVGDAFNFLKTTINGTDAAQAQMAAATDITTQALREQVEAIDTVEEGLANIKTALDLDLTGRQIASMLNQTDLTTAESLQAIADAAGEVEGRLNDATQAFREALDAFKPPGDIAADTAAGMVNSVIAHVPEMQDAYEQMLTPEEGTTIDVEVQAALKLESEGEFHDKVADIIAQGVADGTIVDDASMDAFLTDFGNQLAEAGLEGDALIMAQNVIAGFISGDFSSTIDPIVAALTDRAALAEAGRIMAEQLRSAFSTTLNASRALGGPAALGALVGTGTAPTAALPFPADPDAGSDEGETAGGNYMEHISIGANHGQSRAISAMKPIVQAVGTGVESTASSSGTLVGIKFVKSVGAGITSAAQVATSASSQVANGVKLAAAQGNQGMQNAGSNLARSLARGIQNSAIIAVLAAAAMAQAVVTKVQTILQIGSPSKVFTTIGRQIGEGFVAGIEDSEVSMTQALETAMSNAIQAATETAATEVNRANVANTLFGLLQPSRLPGGTPLSEETNATAKITQQIADFATDLLDTLKDKLSDVLDGLGTADLSEAGFAVGGINLDMRLHQEDIAGQVADARTRDLELRTYDARLRALNSQRDRGVLATVRRGRLEGEAYRDLQHDQEILTDKIARLRVQLNNGTLAGKTAADRLATFNEKVKDLRDSFDSTSLEHYRDAMAQIRIDFDKGRLGLLEYNEQLEKLGDRPDKLSLTEQQAIAGGAGTSLLTTTVIGRANRDAITDALEKIKDYAQAQIDVGVAATTVTADMTKYVKALRDQAIAMGFNKDQVDALIKAYGLNSTAINTLLATYTSLDATTVAGAGNVLRLNEQLGDIREYAATLLEAGTPAAAVRTSIIALVSQFRATAVSAGFTAAAIDKLIADMGLSTTALNDFIAQLNAFTAATNAANAATDAATAAGGTVGRAVGELHVHVPYGDPEAVGRATVNAMAYGGPTTW